MNLDWAIRAEIDNRMVVFDHKTTDRPPRVTIGMPTFNRADTVVRALRAVARQSYRDFVVIVSDNAGSDPATVAAVQGAANDLPQVRLIAQNHNIGALANLHFLLSIAQTEFFMWLADDDEISETFLADLVMLLDAHPAAVSAMGQWRSMTNSVDGTYRSQAKHTASNRIKRVFRFVIGPTDDAVFYGLHRTHRLRKGRFGGFVPPNRGVLTNWCYVFLFDLIWQGPIKYAQTATWISHNYSEKHYTHATAMGVVDRVKTCVRWLNVYALYCAKTAHKNPAMLLITLPAAMLGMARDMALAFGRGVRRIGQKVMV